ncbi:MAG TPA: murein L,D-transpeptidase catalytic domain family protein [Longimicrobium sp.]|nr:murein L,D-transpeptidase catalytic domain family protein [Longimicrobium sp.]
MRENYLFILAAAAVVAGGALMTGNDVPASPAPTRIVEADQPAPRTTAIPVARQAARAMLDGVGIESGTENSAVSAALARLGGKVRHQSDPNALRFAFKAYYNYKAANPRQVRKPYLYYVDYGLDAKTPRGYVFDMKALRVVDGPFNVAHGRGSAPTSNGIPTRFSNRNGSNATSLGLFLAQETYGFSGKSAGKVYRSPGLRLKGLSGRYNSAARARGVVVHGAPYVTASTAGRSEGCPALEQARARKLLPRIANGSLVFLFSPLDRGWMRQDPWATADDVG